MKTTFSEWIQIIGGLCVTALPIIMILWVWVDWWWVKKLLLTDLVAIVTNLIFNKKLSS